MAIQWLNIVAQIINAHLDYNQFCIVKEADVDDAGDLGGILQTDIFLVQRWDNETYVICAEERRLNVLIGAGESLRGKAPDLAAMLKAGDYEKRELQFPCKDE